MTFFKGLLIGHLHRPPHPMGKGSLYSSYYHDQTTLYREDLPSLHHQHHSQQHVQNQNAQYDVDVGQNYHQDSYLGPNNPVSSQFEVYSTDSSAQDEHNRDLYDGDHFHYPLTDNHSIYDTYTG